MYSLAPLIALVLSFSAQDTGSVLSDDGAKQPIGVATDIRFYEQLNSEYLAMKPNISDLMNILATAKREGRCVEVPSGTKAQKIGETRLRGPLHKRLLRVAVTEGPKQGLKGWVDDTYLISGEEFARRKKEFEAVKELPFVGHLTFLDPKPGEEAYLCRQPPFNVPGPFGDVARTIYVTAPDFPTYKEWYSAPPNFLEDDPKAGALEKKLLREKKLFITLVNTKLLVRQIFPDKEIESGYPVEVQILDGTHKGRVVWVAAYSVSWVPYKKGKGAEGVSSRRQAELQTTLDKRRKARVRNKTQGDLDGSMSVPGLDISRAPFGYSHQCGAPTREGTPCRRLVAGAGFCYQHR